MKIIDRYLTKQFVQTILFALAAFTLIFVIMNMMENLDDFIDEDVPNEIILQYYIVFIPEILKLMIPVSVLLSSLFVAGKMSSLNELTAIKSSGISLYRFMIPFIATAVIISMISVYFGGYVVPMANKHRIYIERTYMKKGLVESGRNIFFQDAKTRIVSISTYNVHTDLAYKISIQEFDSSDVTKMVLRYDAARMKYDSTNSNWMLFNGTLRIFNDNSEKMESFITREISSLDFVPDDIIKKQRKVEEMDLGELEEFASDQLKAGNDPTRILIEYHSRFAFAFASLITVLFGLPISANKRRGGVALQFGINLLITFVYLVFMQISRAFGKNGVMDPFFTAWLANFIFLAAAVLNIIRARK
ncbi:MAG: LptF/LptG family permease [Melioribacteraceae bacterium]|nr:LptF/LptG family permease [Melioribacteraceae bacterium]